MLTGKGFGNYEQLVKSSITIVTNRTDKLQLEWTAVVHLPMQIVHIQYIMKYRQARSC